MHYKLFNCYITMSAIKKKSAIDGDVMTISFNREQ